MGFLDRLKTKREIERLEHALKASPSPQICVELADRHIAAGDAQRAFEVIENGHRAFPSSEQVFKFYVSLKKRQVQDTIRELTMQIAQRASASACARLASLYREIHEEERCIDTCREAIERFPSDDGCHQILGEIRLERFRADHYHKDGLLAALHLEKAVERNETNYKAFLALSKLYLEIGAVGHALKRLRDIQAFAPADAVVEELLSAAERCPRPANEDVDELIREVEKRGRMTFPLAPGRRTQARTRAPGYELEKERAAQAIGRFARFQGFLAAGIAVDERLVAFANASGEAGPEGEGFASAMNDYVKAVVGHTRRMDIGNLTRAQVDGAFGQLYLSRAGRVVLAVLLGQANDSSRVWEELQAFLDGCAVDSGDES